MPKLSKLFDASYVKLVSVERANPLPSDVLTKSKYLDPVSFVGFTATLDAAAGGIFDHLTPKGWVVSTVKT